MDQNFDKKSGALDLAYAQGREDNRALRYRLRRRTDEVCRAAQHYLSLTPKRILDLGAADGRMLDRLSGRFPQAQCVGVEYDRGLAGFAFSHFPNLEICIGDVQNLGFPDSYFDLAVAAAVIEHLPEPDRMIAEVNRVLKPGGVLVLTAPDPFWEEIAHRIGHLKGDVHHMVMNLTQLSQLAREGGLEVLAAEKFMISPVGCPGELGLEKALRRLGLNCLMLNQLLVARKPDAPDCSAGGRG